MKPIKSVCLITLVGAVLTAAAMPIAAAEARQGEEPLLPDAPGEPPNATAKVEWDDRAGTLRLRYDGRLLFEGRATGVAMMSNATARLNQALTQTLTFTGRNARLESDVLGAGELIAAETRGPAQEKLPLVRTTSGGPSRNLRNNAVYDRDRDWLLAGPAGAAHLIPQSATRLKLVCAGDTFELYFRPRFYQHHKNITYFRPWTYQRVLQVSMSEHAENGANLRNSSLTHSRLEIQFGLLRCQFAQQRALGSR